MGWEGLPLWPGMGSAETHAESLMPIKVKFVCVSWSWLGQPSGGLQAYGKADKPWKWLLEDEAGTLAGAVGR